MKRTKQLFAGLLTVLVLALTMTLCAPAALAAGEDESAAAPAAAEATDPTEAQDDAAKTDEPSSKMDARLANFLFAAMAAQLVFDVALVVLLKKNKSLPSIRSDREKQPTQVLPQYPQPVTQNDRTRSIRRQPTQVQPNADPTLRADVSQNEKSIAMPRQNDRAADPQKQWMYDMLHPQSTQGGTAAMYTQQTRSAPPRPVPQQGEPAAPWQNQRPTAPAPPQPPTEIQSYPAQRSDEWTPPRPYSVSDLYDRT